MKQVILTSNVTWVSGSVVHGFSCVLMGPSETFMLQLAHEEPHPNHRKYAQENQSKDNGTSKFLQAMEQDPYIRLQA